MHKASYKLLALQKTRRYRGVEIWNDPWLKEAIPLMTEAHEQLSNLPQPEAFTKLTDITASLSSFIEMFEQKVWESISSFHEHLPHQGFNTGIVTSDGRTVPWNVLIRVKNDLSRSNHSDPDPNSVVAEVGCRLWILAAVRGVRNGKIQRLGNEKALFHKFKNLPQNSVGIADDQLLDEHEHHYVQYLKNARALNDKTVLSLKLAWDNEHAKVIDSKLRKTYVGNKWIDLNKAMNDAKDLLEVYATNSKDAYNTFALAKLPETGNLETVLAALTPTITRLCNIVPDVRWDEYLDQQDEVYDPTSTQKTLKQRALAAVLGDVQKKAPAFRRCKALVIMIDQLVSLLKYKAQKQKLMDDMQKNKLRTLEYELPAQSTIPNKTKQIQSEQIAVAFQQTTDENIKDWIGQLDEFERNDLKDLINDKETTPGVYSLEQSSLDELQQKLPKTDFIALVRKTDIEKNIWDSLNITQRTRLRDIYKDNFQKAEPANQTASDAAIATAHTAKPVQTATPKAKGKKKKSKQELKKDDESTIDDLDQLNVNDVFDCVNRNDLESLKSLFTNLNSKLYNKVYIKSILDTRDDNGMSALDNACCEDNDELARFLIEKEADFKTSALHSSVVAESSHRCFDLIMERNLELLNSESALRKFVNQTDTDVYGNNYHSSNSTPLLLSIQFRNDTHVTKQLLIFYADTNATDNQGFTALMYAMQKDNGDFAELCLTYMEPRIRDKGFEGDALSQELRTQIDAKNQLGYTALMYGVEYGNVQAVKALIDAGADVNLINSEDGHNALTYACRTNPHGEENSDAMASKKAAIVEMLLKAGTKYKFFRDRYGKNALMIAAENGECLCLKEILTHHESKTKGDGLRASTARLKRRIDIKGKADAQFFVNMGKKTESPSGGETALCLASKYDHTQCVDLLLEHGADADFHAKDRMTPLMWACKRGNVKNVNAILAHTSSLEWKDDNAMTALKHACTYEQNRGLWTIKMGFVARRGEKPYFPPKLSVAEYHTNHGECVRLLLEKGAKVDNDGAVGFFSGSWATPLMHACESNAIRCIEILIAYGADPLIATPDKQYTPALMRAVLRNKFESVDTLLNAVAVAKNMARLKALTKKESDTEVMDLILNQISNIQLNTALHTACQKKHLKCIKSLLQHNVDTYMSNATGRTPLMLCISSARKKNRVFAYRYERLMQAHPHLRDDAQPMSKQCMLLLLKHIEGKSDDDIREELNHKDNRGNTTLISASAVRNYNCIEALVKYAPLLDVNIKNNTGKTALIASCVESCARCTRSLLTANADLELRDNNNMSAMAHAITSDAADCCKLLMQRGVDIRMADGSTILNYAIERNSPQCVETFLDMSFDGKRLIDIEYKPHTPPLILSALLAFPDYVSLLLAKKVKVNEMIERKENKGKTKFTGDALMLLIMSLGEHPGAERGSFPFPPVDKLKRFGIQKVIKDSKISAATRNIIHERLKTCSFQTLIEDLHHDQVQEVFNAYVSAYGAEAMKCVTLLLNDKSIKLNKTNNHGDTALSLALKAAFETNVYLPRLQNIIFQLCQKRARTHRFSAQVRTLKNFDKVKIAMDMMFAKHKASQYSLEFLLDDEVEITGGRYEGRTGRIVEDDTDQTLSTSRLPVKMHSVQYQADDLIDPLEKLLIQNDPAVKMIEMDHLRKLE